MRRLRYISGCIGLLAAATAAGADCPNAAVVDLLARLDRTQITFDEKALTEIFSETARITAESPARTWARGRAEFIAEKRDDTKQSAKTLAYAFEPPVITCPSATGIEVHRRGCQVMRDGASLLEIAQTEELVLLRSERDIRVAQMKSTLDGMRSDGKALFQNRPFVELKECADAVGNQN